MTTSWSTNLSYGFLVDTSLLEQNLYIDDDLCQDFDSEFLERYPLLTLTYGGNMEDTSKGYECWAVLKSSVFNLEEWAGTVDLDKLQKAESDEPALAQLWEFVNDVGIAVGNLEWRLKIYRG